MEELEGVICLDPALASSTLRLANSAYFGGGSAQIDNVTDALMQAGLASSGQSTSWSTTPRCFPASAFST